MSYQMVQTVSVNMDNTVCDNFLGLNAVYHGFAWMPEQISRGMSDADRSQEFERLKECRIRIARSMFIPSYNCEDISGPYDMQSQRMQAIVKWCRAMKDIGVNVALQAGWHYSSNTYYGHDGPDPVKDPEIFAEWAAQSFTYLIRECGLTNIRYLFLFTEPTAYSSGITPEGFDIWTYYVKICKTIDRKFREAGLRCELKFVGPNNTFGGAHLKESVRDLNDVIDIYSGHDYNYVKQGEWYQMSKKMMDIVIRTGKPLWLDEYGMQLEIFRTTPEYGNYLAQIVAASICAGHQTSLVWILFDQLYTGKKPLGLDAGEDDGAHMYNADSFHDGVHRWGLCSWQHDTLPHAGSPYPAWYAFVLMSRAMGGRLNGEKVQSLEVKSAMTVYGAATCQNGEYAFMIVNGNAYETPVELKLSKDISMVLYRRAFDPKEPAGYGTQAAPSKMRLNEKGMLSDILPASGFTVYTTREIL